MSRNPRTRRSIPVLIPALATLLLAAAPLPEAAALEEAPFPTADTVLEKFVEATGGRAAYEGVQSVVTEATMEMVAQGITLNLTLWFARPGLAYSFAEAAALGTIEKGTNGTVVWEKSVMAGPRILEGQERDDFLREVAFDKYLRWRDFYEKGEVEAVVEVEGRSCYVLLLTPKTGKPQRLYVDRDSGLLSKITTTLETQMGSMPFETTLEDYREVDGLKSAYRARTKIAGQERVLQVKSLRRNVEVPPDRFALPAEIEDLLARKSESPASATPAAAAPSEAP